MKQEIHVISSDVYKTALQAVEPYGDAYKDLLMRLAFPEHKEIGKALQSPIMRNGLSLEETAEEICRMKDGAVPDKKTVDAALKESHRILSMQVKYGYARNAQFDALKVQAFENALSVGLTSDLAPPYGVILKNHFHDVDLHVLSYEEHTLKGDGSSFIRFAEKAGCSIEKMAHVGDNLEADYLAARELGMAAFWYVPNALRVDKKMLAKYEKDIVTDLRDVVPTLWKRGYRFAHRPS